MIRLREDFMENLSEYIDFSENEELWKEVPQVEGLGMAVFEDGVKITRAEYVAAFIQDHLEDQVPREKTIAKLQELFRLSREEAEASYDKYSHPKEKRPLFLRMAVFVIRRFCLLAGKPKQLLQLGDCFLSGHLILQVILNESGDILSSGDFYAIFKNRHSQPLHLRHLLPQFLILRKVNVLRQILHKIFPKPNQSGCFSSGWLYLS